MNEKVWVKIFTEGRDLGVESPQEGFYIRKIEDGSQEIRLWELHAGTKVESSEQATGMLGMMTAGEIEFWIGDHHKHVFPSDVVRIPPQTPYRFRVIGDRTARIIWIRTT